MVASRCVGAAQRLVDEVTAFARDRIVDGKPLGEHNMLSRSCWPTAPPNCSPPASPIAPP